jgi:signal peptidase I
MKILKEIIPYIVIIIVVVLIRTFIATPVLVNGSSMYPTLKNNELLLLKKYDSSYKRYDIVVLNYKNEKLIKRVIGLPGEIVEYKDGILYIDGKKTEDEFSSITSDFKSSELITGSIPEGYYLVMGDNRKNSIDSRTIGLINEDDINGVTNFSLWPFGTFEK